MKGRFSLHLYAKMDTGIRARMFGPLSGTVEDAATGSANATLGALLLILSGGNQATYHIAQGVEMRRPSELRVVAEATAAGITAKVGGDCVEVLRGAARL